MYTFAGKFIVFWNNEIDLNYSSIRISIDDNKTLYYIYWETKLESSNEILDDIKSLFEVLAYDISISSEDKIILFSNISWKEYSSITLEWKNLLFDDVLTQYKDTASITSIREVEVSKFYGNKKIRIDFIN